MSTPTRLDRLKPYLQTPRDMETPFSSGRWQAMLPGCSGSLEEEIYGVSRYICSSGAGQQCFVETGRQRLLSGSVCFCPRQEAHSRCGMDLSQNGRKRSANCQIVLLCQDDCRKLINTLRDSQSEFCFRIGKRIGDADAQLCYL